MEVNGNSAFVILTFGNAIFSLQGGGKIATVQMMMMVTFFT